MNDYINKMINFIDDSPSPYHTVASAVSMLEDAGGAPLLETEDWKLKAGKIYYVTRNNSSIVAFRVPSKNPSGLNIAASHSDSPCLKIKTNPEIKVADAYVKLNVERYGGLILNTFMDRPLSIAGRVMVRNKKGFETRLVDFNRPMCIIPNLAIHMNRKINDGYEYNVQRDLLPLWSGGSEDTFTDVLAKELDISVEDIIESDLFLYNWEVATVTGADKSFVSSRSLDDLSSAYSSLEAFINSKNTDRINMCVIFDNEEVGSGTKQGADSSFLKDVIERIAACIDVGYVASKKLIANSYMISCDNAHGLHPNIMDKSDPTNRPVLNGGVVIKYNADQKYTTDAISAAVFREICSGAKIPLQEFTNRSDERGGSTLGNISNSQVALNTVDIGIAQLAMHSSYETCGVKDVGYMINALKAFYNSSISYRGDVVEISK